MMKVMTQCYRSRVEATKDDDIDKMMKNFQAQKKLRYIIPPSMVEKYNDEICFMVETGTTCMEFV